MFFGGVFSWLCFPYYGDKKKELFYSSFSFSIHLVNNYDEEFFCNLKIDNDMTNNAENSEGIFDGYIMKIIDRLHRCNI